MIVRNLKNWREISFKYDNKGQSCLHTIPDFNPDTDINVIYKKTQLGQHVPSASVMPSFKEFPELVNYDRALEMIMKANESFQELDAETRKKYNNDPKYYYEETLKEAKADADVKASIEAKKADVQAKAEKLKEAEALVNANKTE